MQIKDPRKPQAKSPREIAISRAIRMITNLLRTVIFLMQNGVYVIGFRGKRNAAGRDQIVIRVAPSPYLATLFPGAVWLKQRHDGVLTIHTWFAECAGIHVEWEDICPTH